MSRSGYSDDLDQGDLNRWRGAVASAIRGKRGQSFLRELLASLDAMPRKELISEAMEASGVAEILRWTTWTRRIGIGSPNDSEFPPRSSLKSNTSTTNPMRR